ncbi:phospholipase D-like domain-containing anti-phage protein [Thermorudis peleae]|uniref:phospholipase D-like domain-containing anti-phage protein n=1 Tax=Thermorudis peleae TaxID=1382356 RepID=UPI000571D284|nr:phospholipase D-like domain-containing anti-phage protein [Thermorudis peleae]
MLLRYSSRLAPLRAFLTEALEGALAYDRIAGFFSSSILEVAGEPLERMAPGAQVRVIANSALQPLDVETARAAKAAMYAEWCQTLPEYLPPRLKERLRRLYTFLASGQLQVRVLPDAYFGLIHGKAGVITRADGSRIAFLGSVNESREAWEVNYELLWADDSEDGVRWTSEEFEALWYHSGAINLADAVVRDIERLSRRIVVPSIAEWRETYQAEPAAAAVELPVARQGTGLWAHQKSFVKLAFDLHRHRGARLILADEVGLGKTVQLGLAAKLMVLWGGGNVLVLVPKPLVGQWQDELWDLLALPSAVWTGRTWIDENGVEYPANGVDGLQHCPRKVGIVSAGLITQSDEAAEVLANLHYECVIVDEAHRAGRRNRGASHRNEKADPNNLLRFLQRVAERTRSLLLATATPVQLDPIEAWDLLEALNRGNETVLGSRYSRWLTRPREGLNYVLNWAKPPENLRELWEWVRDPLPPASEAPAFEILRRSLNMNETESWAPPEAFDRLSQPARRHLEWISREFFQNYNPFLRHIVRRTREYLEQTIDPETGEPYLTPVRVRLFGEGEHDALLLPPLLQDAYNTAEEFCQEVASRPGFNSGFLKTLLLRRVGSTIEAGRLTAQRLLEGREQSEEDEEDERPSSLHPLTQRERELLERFLQLLEAARAADPKLQAVTDILCHGVDDTEPWRQYGCIVFSQYYDSAHWIAQHLSQYLPEEEIGLYAGANKSKLFQGGNATHVGRDVLKERVQRGELRILVGTDAASEGLNLQRLGALINVDLPWNPTRLEQRKGRIQRIGQPRPIVFIYNLRYQGSVEDRVHRLLSARLQAIHALFGQLPDTLEDVWIALALRQEERARQIIDATPLQHPFELRYHRVTPVDWESCAAVLEKTSQLEFLRQGWK